MVPGFNIGFDGERAIKNLCIRSESYSISVMSTNKAAKRTSCISASQYEISYQLLHA